MKDEAVYTLKQLGVLNNTIKEFEKENVINKSEVVGILYWLSDEEEEKK